MTTLEPDECRVLGVLIEKAQTTPAQYPLTLNAIVSGCNQKSNRDPVVNYDEQQVQSALDRLRGKGLSTMVHMAGSRVSKYRHNGQDGLDVQTIQLSVLAELLLRGPQTLGEIRTRVSRMRVLENLDAAHNVLQSLIEHDPPFVQRVAPAPGSRAERFGQLLCPDLHPIEAAPAALTHGDSVPVSRAATATDPALLKRMADLEDEVAHLRRYLDQLAERLGEPGPTASE